MTAEEAVPIGSTIPAKAEGESLETVTKPLTAATGVSEEYRWLTMS
jgi:hypothetical protein